MNDVATEEPPIEATTDPTYREMPWAPEIEQALLGALLVNNKVVDRVSSMVSPEDFYEGVHGRIYDAIVKTVQAGRVADPLKMVPYFEGDEGLDCVGGASYLMRLAASAATIINAVDYAQTIADLATRRQIISIGEEMVEIAYDSPVDHPAQDQIEEAETALRDLATGATDTGTVRIGDAMKQEIDEIDASHESGIQPGLTTGLMDLDAQIGGLHKTDLIIIGGRPGMCKTTLGCNIARGAAQSLQGADGQHSGTVGFYSLEMDTGQLSQRMMTDLSLESKIEYGDARKLKFSSEQRSILRQNVNLFENMPLEVIDIPSMTIGHLTAHCRRMASRLARKKQPLKLVVIDYLQLISPPKGVFNQVAHISECSRQLKLLAKELKIPVILLSQLNRAVEMRENKRPMLSDLRDSGTIEQDADMVLFTYREEEYLKGMKPGDGGPKDHVWQEKMYKVENLMEVGVGKQRHGPTGMIRLACFAGYGSIRDRAQREMI